MKNNTIVIFLNILFIVINSPIANADDIDVFNYPLTVQNTNTFNTICLKLAERPITKGSFEQEKRLNRLGRSLISSGNFIISAEHGMVWDTLRPFPSVMVLGNNFMKQSRPDGQISIVNAQGNETFVQMASVISAIFSGESRGLLENFNVFFFGDQTNWNIGLIPKDNMIASFAERIIMRGTTVSNGSAVIRTILIFERSGDIITYTLSNHTYPSELNTNEKAFFEVK